MKRHEEQQARPTAGCLSVPLFNQKKRTRMPVTSTPSETDFCVSSNESMPSTSAPFNFNSAQGGGYQGSRYPNTAPAPQAQAQGQGHFWTRQRNPQPYPPSQQTGGNRPAPGPAPAARPCGVLPHPYKPGNTSHQVSQQESVTAVHPKQNSYRPSTYTNERTGLVQTKPGPERGSPQTAQHGSYPQASSPSNVVYTQAARPRLPQPGGTLTAQTPAQTQSASWRFKPMSNTGSPRGPREPNHSTYRSQSAPGPQTQKSPAAQNQKSSTGPTLRILTAVIAGMKHWSQFKDRVPFLFEIFATLDSAVTMGSHGSKSFLLRDGKETVQCVFYENEQELPRLIRGQVQRCVGNYDQAKELLVCVSVRPGLPSEQRNAQEAVKACNVEMSALVKSFSEV